MDCPVCKYPNTAGATHCGMCYEVFNRSAAQAYLHAVKRDRREADGAETEPAQETTKLERAAEKSKAFMENIDWNKVKDAGRSFIAVARKPFLILAGVIALWLLMSFLFSAGLAYQLFGKSLTYSFPDNTPAPYLVGLTQNIKIWSERQNRLDTPMSEFTSNELGNIFIEKKSAAEKNRGLAFVNTKEWIQFLTDAAGSESRTLPKNHPTLAGAKLFFDKKGVLLERRFVPSPRLAKSLPFLVPRFPKSTLRRGRTWDEPVEWLDVYGDWKIYWAGTLHWTLGDLEPCGDDSCAKLTYKGDLRPQLRGSPEWAQGAMGRPGVTVTTEGTARFDISRRRVTANTFSYEGVLHLPLSDLGRIPWEDRIGRGVKGQPGTIVIRFDNKIDIRKN